MPPDYLSVRGLGARFGPDVETPGGGRRQWQFVDREVFAEDFSYFFGAGAPRHDLAGAAGLPDARVAGYILSLAARCAVPPQGRAAGSDVAVRTQERRLCGARRTGGESLVVRRHDTGQTVRATEVDAGAHGGVGLADMVDLPEVGVTPARFLPTWEDGRQAGGLLFDADRGSVLRRVSDCVRHPGPCRRASTRGAPAQDPGTLRTDAMAAPPASSAR
jgi:hypothetical protein